MLLAVLMTQKYKVMEKKNNNTSGYTDSRGEWRPDNPIVYAPLFVWPPKIRKFLLWLFHYLFTWNLLYLGIVILSYYFLQPPMEQMKDFHYSWISTILLRNMTLVWIIYGGWHLYLYKFKKRGTKAKYCPRWQSTDGSTFLWNDQVYDNVFWSCVSGVPIWTAYEVVTYWLYANGKLPYIDFQQHPVWFVTLFLLIPLWRELHFYLIHRLIHWKPLYDKIHYLHHYNINPGPWSGLAMHPVEHLLYFSVVLIHWVVPSHPLHFLFNSQHTALTPAPGHTGFEGKIFKYLSFGSYFHYLHHRLFECNYGESTIPLDKWFGIFEEGAQTQTEKFEATSVYNKLRVTKIEEESSQVKSFYFTSADDSKLEPNVAGQHLIFKVPFFEGYLCQDSEWEEGAKINYALRSYTISNGAENNTYRISVKREEQGRVSNALHNSLKVGDVLQAKGPRGNFVLDKKKRPSVFIAGGIGITPILSMLHSLKDNPREIILIIAAKKQELIVFRDELQSISDQHPNIKAHLFLSQSQNNILDPALKTWQVYYERLGMDRLKELLPKGKHFNFYICGPAEMNAHFVEKINEWKGAKSIVYTENFGPAKNGNAAIDTSKEVKVKFKKAGQTLIWDYEYVNLLEFAESNGIRMEAGCMFGECGACSTKIESGDVAYNFNTATKPSKGHCLPCSCRPTSDIEINA
jgi:ferredoxin-NADP reductase/sterol desaturase/sphingolipid hydroxylase (fatty acid hydroxylase superfamily)